MTLTLTIPYNKLKEIMGFRGIMNSSRDRNIIFYQFESGWLVHVWDDMGGVVSVLTPVIGIFIN